MSDPSLEAQVQNLEARLALSEESRTKLERDLESAQRGLREFHDMLTEARADREQAEKALADCMRQQGSPYVLGGDVLPENVAGVQS